MSLPPLRFRRWMRGALLAAAMGHLSLLAMAQDAPTDAHADASTDDQSWQVVYANPSPEQIPGLVNWVDIAPLAPEEAAEPSPESAVAQAANPETVIETGRASWYGRRFQGRRTASGERFDMNAFTAAHPSLPFGSLIKVRNPDTGNEVQVRVNDRGPHVRGRIIDVSYAAAQALGLLDSGHAVVVLMRP